MFRSSRFFLFAFLAFLSSVTYAQQLQILFPQEGQQVRGEITVRYSGVPDGGHVMVMLDGNFVMATALNTFQLNTFDLKAFSPSLPNEGTHKLTLRALNAGGKRVDEKTVTFEAANTRVDASGEGVVLSHYEDWMRLDPNVQRYRVYAESNAMIDDGQGGGGGGAAGGGGGESGAEIIPAPLDWQVSALMRRVVRDIGGWSDTRLTRDKSDDVSSANIRTVVQEAFQRQREGEGGGGGQGVEGGGGAATKPVSRKKASSGPAKAPWAKDWTLAPEVGQYFVKNIEPSGREINATRKTPTIALADLLPTFPLTEVRPGSTWETRMTFLGDLSSRQPVNVSVPITLTTFENIQTPGGFSRRAAKLESRFQMPEAVAKKMAINLILQGGIGGGGGGGGEGGGGAGAPGIEGGGNVGAATEKTAATLPPEELEAMMEGITGISSRASRVLWFDVENHRVLHSEDTIRTSFAYESVAAEGGGDAGGAAGAPGEGGGQAAEPTKVSYNLVVKTWFDDTVPGVHPKYNGGAGTAHSRDNVTDATIERINKPVQP